MSWTQTYSDETIVNVEDSSSDNENNYNQHLHDFESDQTFEEEEDDEDEEKGVSQDDTEQSVKFDTADLITAINNLIETLNKSLLVLETNNQQKKELDSLKQIFTQSHESFLKVTSQQ